MPEGPSIVILREKAAQFSGSTVRRFSGNSRIDLQRLQDQQILSVRSWGKQFLLEFQGFALRIHLLLFGTYRINERKDTQARLSLGFDQGELNFYTCSIKFIEGQLDEAYDWTADVMSPTWSADAAVAKLRAMPETLVCDALLDQTVFAGVGNIIKNEVLFRLGIHPLSTVGGLPQELLQGLISEARIYSFEFLEWKMAFVLKQHWLAHTKTMCARCSIPLKKAKLGRTRRRSFYCEHCQVLYGGSASASSPLPLEKLSSDEEEASTSDA